MYFPFSHTWILRNLRSYILANYFPQIPHQSVRFSTNFWKSFALLLPLWLLLHKKVESWLENSFSDRNISVSSCSADNLAHYSSFCRCYSLVVTYISAFNDILAFGELQEYAIQERLQHITHTHWRTAFGLSANSRICARVCVCAFLYLVLGNKTRIDVSFTFSNCVNLIKWKKRNVTHTPRRT